MNHEAQLSRMTVHIPNICQKQRVFPEQRRGKEEAEGGEESPEGRRRLQKCEECPRLSFSSVDAR